MARSRFWCWLRSLCTATTMPVGRCVMRTAQSVLLTCWPPAPEARYVSTRSSFSSISTLASSGTSGITSTSAKLVCRRFCESNGLIRTSRCTPRSLRSRPYAQRPSIVKLTALQAGLLALGRLEDLGLEAAPLGPAQVHPQQHLGPVLALGPARAGVDRDDRAALVERLREEELLLHARPVGLERGEVALEVGAAGLARLRRVGGGHLGHLGQARRRAARARASCAMPERSSSARRMTRLRLGRVVPEVGVGGALGQVGELGLVAGEVKGAPRCRARGRPAAGPRP